MTGPLLDDLLDQLRGGPARQLSQQLGLSPDAAMDAIGTALPVLLGALHHNVRGGGAPSLFNALELDHRGIDPSNALATALAGGGSGAGILGHVLGGHQDSAARAVGTSTGIGEERGAQLLRVLAPVVMAYLARRVFTPRETDGPSTPQASPEGVRDALEAEVAALHERSGVHAGLLSLLDRDRDGDVDLADFTAGGTGALPVQTAEMRSPRPRI